MKPWEQASVRTLLEALLQRTDESYLVGGIVRDALMGLPGGGDIDVAVRGDGYGLAESLAGALSPNASFVPLDPERGTGRIVLEKGAAGSLDISSFKGDSIEEDLRARDFTINAVAVSVRDLLETGTFRLVDPCGGRKDLESRCIRVCSPSAFHDDSLRVLRAFRLKTLLEFEIHEGTVRTMKEALPLLTGVAGERIRDELFIILNADNCFGVLAEMDRMGVLGVLFPRLLPMKGVAQNPFHHLDVWEHSLESVQKLEILLANGSAAFGELSSHVQEYADSELVIGRSRRALMKLALLFHDAGKPDCAFRDQNARMRFFGHEKVSRLIFLEAADSLKLAAREIRLEGEWIAGHMRAMIFTEETVSKRALHRLHRKFGREAIGLLLIFLADLAASQGPARRPGENEHAFQQVCLALKAWLDAAEKPPQRILNGNDVMEALGLKTGPIVGRILNRLAELQAEGEVNTREDALAAAKDLLKQMGS